LFSRDSNSYKNNENHCTTEEEEGRGSWPPSYNLLPADIAMAEDMSLMATALEKMLLAVPLGMKSSFSSHPADPSPTPYRNSSAPTPGNAQSIYSIIK